MRASENSELPNSSYTFMPNYPDVIIVLGVSRLQVAAIRFSQF